MRRSTRPSRTVRWLVPTAAAAICTLAAGHADAAPAIAGADGKRFRLHGELDFLSYYHYNPDGPGINLNGGGFGIGRSTLMDSGGTFPGLHPRPVWSLGFGYVFLQHRAIVGGKFAFAIDGIGQDDETDPANDDRITIVSGIFVPYFRWVFLPGRRFRPYAEIHVGLGGGAVTAEDDDSDSRVVSNTIFPAVGAAGGFHIFIIDAFSLDLGIAFDYYAPHSKLKTETPMGTTETDMDKDADVINLAIQSGISVWF